MTVTDDQFWASIDAAWSGVRGSSRALSALNGKNNYVRRVAVTGVNLLVPEMLKALERSLRSYSAAELREWDAQLQKAVEELDRQDVRIAVRSASDEVFLYARAWVVAAGREYYANVLSTPKVYGVPDQWAEEVLYVAERVYEKRYGKWQE